MSNCALCDIEITLENDSREHIVPQSIGGRRWVRAFLCKSCNSKAGETWDAVTAEQLNFLCLLFAIQRQDGTVPAGEFETESGQAVAIHPDGHLSLPNIQPAVKISGSNVQIQATRRTKEEARQMFRGMRRRYPKLNIDEAMQKVGEERTYLSEPVRATLNFGGTKSGRSVVKSALAFAVASGISVNLCEQAVGYLRKDDRRPCFGYFYRRDLVSNRPTDKVFHCVAIRADPKSQTLVGYVEFFSLYRMIVCLSSEYTGTPLFNYYAVDPTSGQELAIDLDLSLTEEELRRACANEEDYAVNLSQVFQGVFAIGQSISVDRERNRVVERAWKECIAKLGFSPGDTLRAEDVSALSKCLAAQIEPFLTHLAFRKDEIG